MSEMKGKLRGKRYPDVARHAQMEERRRALVHLKPEVLALALDLEGRNQREEEELLISTPLRGTAQGEQEKEQRTHVSDGPARELLGKDGGNDVAKHDAIVFLLWGED